MKNKNKVVRVLLIVSLLSLPLLLRAQGPGFGDDVGDTPIDGGVSLLAIAGIGYGAKKIRDMKKKKMNAEGKETTENTAK